MSKESISTIDKKKRVRAPNFTTEETRLLLKLALSEKHIIENKKTDSETWKLKDNTWRRMTNIFNSISGETFRSVETLRNKYDGMKKRLKKKVNKNKSDYVLIDGPEKDLLEILSMSVHGLPGQYDSDSVLPQTTVTGEASKCEDELMVFPEESESISEFSRNLVSPITEYVEEFDHPEVNYSDCISEEKEKLVEKIDIGVKKLEENALENSEKGKQLRNQSWQNQSPVSLKTKKHSALTTRKTGRDLLKKMNRISDLREELLRNQINYSKNEERRAQEKHEKEMELLNIQILLKSKELEKL